MSIRDLVRSARFLAFSGWALVIGSAAEVLVDANWEPYCHFSLPAMVVVLFLGVVLVVVNAIWFGCVASLFLAGARPYRLLFPLLVLYVLEFHYLWDVPVGYLVDTYNGCR